MLDEKAAPHGAGPITRSTYTVENNNSDRKWRRILKLLASGAELTRFDAEKIGDHAFNSTVSTLGRMGVRISRRAITIEGRYGTIHCKRYWLEPNERHHAHSLLGDTQ
jgi:hypothetical protein